MKKIIMILFAALFLFGSCEYDDSALTDRIESVEERLAKLEELCSRMNADIASLQTIVSALENNDYVKSVEPIEENGETVGYAITFSRSGRIEIYHGRNGNDGTDGADGADAIVPEIGIEQDSDGVYYWTLDGEWLLDGNGNRIRAVGRDGDNGANGSDGHDGVAPELKIEDGYWWISYDGGESWDRLGTASGEDGHNGEDGRDGDTLFESVDTSDPDCVVIRMSDGTEIKVPTMTAFEALQRRCNELNTNIDALQVIIDALVQKDRVVSIVPVLENGEEAGYDIVFSISGSVRIYHGKEGVAGPSGHTPEIGVSKDSDGIYCWTLDGEWMLDETGSRIPAEGVDGADGADGPQGSVGRTPELEIRDGYWYVTLDEGKTWTRLGKATGEPGSAGEDVKGTSVFREVYTDEAYAYFVLQDETVLKLPLAEGLLFSSVQSLTYLPSGTDGCAKVEILNDGTSRADLTFSVSPVEAISALQSNWRNWVSVKAYFTKDRAITSADFVIMPVVDFSSEPESGTITLTVSGENLGEDFHSGKRSASAQVTVNDGVTSLSSRTIPLFTENHLVPETISIIYTTVDKQVAMPQNGLDFISNDYDVERNVGTLVLSYTTYIPNELFYNEKRLASVTLPEGIVELGAYSFQNCYSLETVILPESLETIGYRAFDNCHSLRSIDFPKGLERIAARAFYDCHSLESVVLPKNLKRLEISTFNSCYSLKSVEFPEGLECVEKYVFEDCYDLVSISIPEGVTSIGYGAFKTCTSLESVVLPDNLESMGGSVFRNCSALKSVVLPDNLESMEGSVFENCSALKSVVLPKNLLDLPKSTFEDCEALDSITLPDALKSIGAEAFEGCLSLSFIRIPESVTSIGAEAFDGCLSLSFIQIPESVTSIGEASFSACTSLSSIHIPEGVTSIGDEAFVRCRSLSSIHIPEGVTSIGYAAFKECKSLSSIQLPESVTSIGRSAFAECISLESIVFPAGVDVLEPNTCISCSALKSVELPSALIHIGSQAFENCMSLSSVQIPETVLSIDNEAFSNCLSLESVHMMSAEPCELGEGNVFPYGLVAIYVPMETVSAYKAQEGWFKYYDLIIGE